MNIKNKLAIATILIILGVVTRLLPHAWNVAPIAAIALFCGTYLGWRYALVVPTLAMALGDMMIGFYNYHLMIVVYGSFIIAGLIGITLKKDRTVFNVIMASMSSSIVFFILTNGAVWFYASWYPHTAAGLLDCFLLALPFFRNTVLGDLMYTAILFGATESIMLISHSQIRKQHILAKILG